MPPAPHPSNELQRLAKLRSLGVLDTEAEDRFDRITLLASEIAGMPIAAVSLVDEDRQFFKSICGLDVRETPREQAFCAYTILSHNHLVVKNALADSRFRDNALVTGPPHIRSYIGVPLVVDDLCLGSLCVIDLQPRELSNSQINGLRTLADITASELANRVLRQKAESATLAKSMFLANMSHEIRSPLGVIAGYADVLSDPATDDAEARYAIRAISQNADHLLQLVNGILDLSKIEANQYLIEQIAFHPADAINQAIEMLRGFAEQAGIHVRSNIDDASSTPVLGDPTRLRQIAVNLISNAIKFSDGKDVEVGMACEPGSSPGQVKLSLTVRDYGIGMDAEQLSRVFDEFQQADASSSRRYGGTGLGLAIVRRLVGLMHGTMEVTSDPGRGSCFRVNFQWSEAESPPNGRASARTRAPGEPTPTGSELRGVRVLLAEDGPDNQRLLQYLLSRAGADVVIVQNGQEAWERTSAEPDGFDCILMDMQMPIMDGCEATRRIRGSGCETPILALTANTLSEAMDECMRAGCNGYAQKPIRREDLISRVATLIESSRRSRAA